MIAKRMTNRICLSGFLFTVLLGCSGGDTTDGNGDGDGDGDGTMPTPASLDLLPMAAGNAWTYDITPIDACPVYGSPFTQVMTGPVEIDGKSAYEIETDFCSAAQRQVATDDGQILENQGTWIVELATPLQEGTNWDGVVGESFTYTSVPTITVPAGTFTDCWERTVVQALGTRNNNTYCPGVGIVKAEAEGFLAELSSYAVAP